MTLVIKNGMVIDPASGLYDYRDIKVAFTGPEGAGVIEAIGAGLAGDQVIDAANCVVAPGLVDIHVHFREPGFESKETIESGSRAAARGGFTTVVTMANTKPPIDNAGMVEFCIRRARETAIIKIRPAACATKGMAGQEITEMAELKAVGAVAVTDDGQDIENAFLMRRVLQYANMVDLVCMSHNEDKALVAKGAMNEGYTATVLGIPGIPREAEETRIDRNIRLAALAGAHIHIQHVSSKEGVAIVRRAKARGLRVTAETAPHYFSLTDEAVKNFNTNAKMNPPLREEADRLAVIEGIKDGTIDCIATDHAPHTPAEKEVEFEYAPFGIIGLETALSLTLSELVAPGHLSLDRAVALLTWDAAQICKLNAGRLEVGGPADITIFDPEAPRTISAKEFASKSCNSPFIGRKTQGVVRYTLCDGKGGLSGGLSREVSSDLVPTAPLWECQTPRHCEHQNLGDPSQFPQERDPRITTNEREWRRQAF